MILFYGLPPQLYGQNGMLRRIAHIDSLFEKKERIYCYPAQYTGKSVTLFPKIEKISEKVSFFACNFHYQSHNQAFISLLKTCDFLYAHTVHSAQFLYPYYDSGKIITDLHGIAPEEEDMFGHVNRARFYEAYERTLIQKSYRIIGVTRAMFQHYHEKYGLSPDRFIYLPITPNMVPLARKKRSEATRVIYSGGVQIWQQTPKMLDAVKKLSPTYEFLFLSQQENELKQLARREGIASSMHIKSCTEAELPEYYAWADYGFCLRENSPVNKVSCPTKLMEYAASGVIPIIESDEIGDFFAVGGQAVRLKDMLHKNYPSKEHLDAIRQANYSVISHLLDDVKKGESIMSNLPTPVSSLPDSEWEFRFLDTESRVSLFPAAGQWQCGGLIRTESDICSLHHQVTLTLPQDDMDVSYHISPVPAILQSPVAYAVYKNGIKKEVPYTHNFIRQGKHWRALTGHNTINIVSGLLQNVQSIVIEIHMHSAGNQIYAHTDFRSSWRRKIRHYADIFLPTGTKRRARIKKVVRIIRRITKG